MSDPNFSIVKPVTEMIPAATSSARKYLEQRGVLGLSDECSPAQKAEKLTHNPTVARLSRARLDADAEALEYVAMTYQFISELADQEAVIDAFAMLAGIKRRKNSNRFAIIARATMGCHSGQSEDAAAYRQRWSTSATIIQNLFDAKVPVGQMADRLKLDGLTAWSRNGNNKSAQRKEPDAAKEERLTVADPTGPLIPWPVAGPASSTVLPGQRVVLMLVATGDACTPFKNMKSLVLPREETANEVSAWFMLAEVSPDNAKSEISESAVQHLIDPSATPSSAPDISSHANIDNAPTAVLHEA